MDRRLVLAYTILFVLGVAVFPFAPHFWPPIDALLVLVALALLAGLVEALAIGRTGRRRWLWAWLPPVAGMIAYVLSDLQPQAPDFGLALSVTIAGFAIGIPLFALLVHFTAACMVWVRRARVHERPV
jgi:hypothetical protein